ncbi:unnamed protein product [Rotaria sp. Silwood2]|nr:unnamed protein product [Rotaria sp. Silwood2]CAF2953786.1 unnamed protein product [Rotaria sp. Silwood2]CAF3202858.1 unnamed protein product [Rotaria sp. Silwood2]CAF3953484.1 unnamed protein product [Rotaria sp. Silwood2]CAF4047695.1 unnamed protein product [Rotaria sp. Silwood2]
MFILTIATATGEIVYGIRAHSNSLIADGLYSFAEGLCLIGVLLILHYSHKVGHRPKNNTFGYERLELLFGLVQEVFLLSVSLGVIVDAVNHLINPMLVHDPKLMIIIGIGGTFVGILGMAMFWGYHHDHDIEEEIHEKKKRDILAWTKQHMKPMRTSSIKTHNNTAVEIPLMTKESKYEATHHSDITSDTEITPEHVHQCTSNLDAFTYENVEMSESRIYATLHALCLHSFVVVLESIIVVVSGCMIKFIPHIDPITRKEVNTWLKYVDPLLTLIMVVIIVVRALPVIFSISEILIENVPGGIDTKQLMNEIVTTTPAIKSIHSLHIWRATAKEIYATMHLVCDEDVMLSTCTHKYGKDIQIILKSYCIRYFTLQFEYIIPNYIDELPLYRCVHGLHRKRRGHTLEEPLTKLAKDAIIRIR